MSSVGQLGTVDVHAHIFPADLPAVASGGPWPTLRTGGSRAGQIMLGTRVFREVKSPLWSLTDRIAHMDEHGVELQLVSPVPVTLTYGAAPEGTASFIRSLNEAIARQVGASGGRLLGLGAVPLQDTARAVRELEHAVRDLGLAGAEIGTVVGGRELDHPSLSDFFAAAEDLGARLFIHPLDGGAGAIRRSGLPYDFGLGMLSDTAMAAGALVFGGVLERHPRLRVFLAHGCGTFPWAFPRLRLAARAVDDTDVDRLVKRLHVDNLVFDAEHLPLLVHRFGEDRVMAGTDFPFFPDQETANARMVDQSVADGHLTRDQAADLMRTNALRFLGLDPNEAVLVE